MATTTQEAEAIERRLRPVYGECINYDNFYIEGKIPWQTSSCVINTPCSRRGPTLPVGHIGVQPVIEAYKCFDAYSLYGLPMYSSGSTLQYIWAEVLAYTTNYNVRPVVHQDGGTITEMTRK